jgi:hypothetical protein
MKVKAPSSVSPGTLGTTPAVHIGFPPGSPSPYPVTTPGQFVSNGTIDDSSLIPSATITDNTSGNLIANGTYSPQQAGWMFYFSFPQRVKGKATLTVSATGATSDTKALDFGT